LNSKTTESIKSKQYPR